MRVRAHCRQTTRLAPLLGLLLANGCLARLERNLDYPLVPDALEDTFALPFTTVAPWTQFLLRLVT